MTIEEKARAYDEALETARKINSGEGVPAPSDWTICEVIFPELKESEDERMRKALIRFFQRFPYDRLNDENLKPKDAIAWLEKHKPVEHLELKAGHWYICYRAYCCRADHLTVKEGERFMCEKDDVVKGFVIKDAEKYFKECNAPAPYEDEQDTTQFKYNGSDDVRRQSTIQVLEYARSLDAYNQYGKEDIDKNIAWLEKQGEIDKTSYEISEKEKCEFIGDGFIKCYADFLDFKEGETYWLEYIGNDKYNVRSDNLLGKTYHITPGQLYTIFKKQTWLEKQGELIPQAELRDEQQ